MKFSGRIFKGIIVEKDFKRRSIFFKSIKNIKYRLGLETLWIGNPELEFLWKYSQTNTLFKKKSRKKNSELHIDMTDYMENEINTSKRLIVNDRDSMQMLSSNMLSPLSTLNSPSDQNSLGPKKPDTNFPPNLPIEEEKIMPSENTRLGETRVDHKFEDTKLEETKVDYTINKTLDEKQMFMKKNKLENKNLNLKFEDPDFNDKDYKKDDLTEEQLKLIESKLALLSFFFLKLKSGILYGKKKAGKELFMKLSRINRLQNKIQILHSIK